MKVLVQRVARAEVRVDGETQARIGRGVLVLLGVERADTEEHARWYARRVAALKFFPSPEGELWRCSLGEVSGAVLLVSQFTLPARTRKGRRPSFDPAAPPEEGRRLYECFAAALTAEGLPVETGVFGARMEVELVNDGPVTFLLEGPS
ncbi:MAG: D-aminoacyl-tRNA deacylase [Acidobacteriota bacterium]|nr:D-aminoacyl-tRNA deacylase [Acidobacteriota bacterium]MDQ7086852.1 D-aminoacyl-tRNA deacylase [Acidobacteriota bacterium]